MEDIFPLVLTLLVYNVHTGFHRVKEEYFKSQCLTLIYFYVKFAKGKRLLVKKYQLQSC